MSAANEDKNINCKHISKCQWNTSSLCLSYFENINFIKLVIWINNQWAPYSYEWTDILFTPDSLGHFRFIIDASLGVNML